MSEMVERVAEAMKAHDYGDLPWAKLSADYREQLEDYARAAIEAMREPTPQMIMAAFETGIPHETNVPDMERWYAAMIDAALKKPAKV